MGTTAPAMNRPRRGRIHQASNRGASRAVWVAAASLAHPTRRTSTARNASRLPSTAAPRAAARSAVQVAAEYGPMQSARSARIQTACAAFAPCGLNVDRVSAGAASKGGEVASCQLMNPPNQEKPMISAADPIEARSHGDDGRGSSADSACAGSVMGGSRSWRCTVAPWTTSSPVTTRQFRRAPGLSSSRRHCSSSRSGRMPIHRLPPKSWLR